MSVDWNSHEMSVWKQKARNEQQAYFNLPVAHQWANYGQSDYNNLRRNIGFAMFGLPREEPNKICDYTGYNKKELSCINTVFDVIKNYKQEYKNKEVICVRFIFVYAKIGDNDAEFYVIGVRKYVSRFRIENIFIDSCARVYKNWQDYLKNNKLPECALCYPRNGMYSAVNGQVQVEFGISPAGEISSKVLQGLDITGGVLGLGASGIAVASLFMPVAFPFILGQ
ncbi:hypothetical protein B7P43_G03435 [Cryptotermes secundus]|uniref:DUF4781 domain-containing protein n=1 Tax=Cryptotermes secundus TaxID=105785 RepID=A0A2J7RLL2_9NEOP|nr:hypothetical protein B7P43_G03435 [Cryptotermes secundus]PNF41723.1 hypothetical protein B7P43_G03435 [Cryptotermes secundus]